MPNYHDPETLLIRRQEAEARKHRPPLPMPSSPRAPAARTPMPPPPAPGREKSPSLLTSPPRPGSLTASWLKVTTKLNAAELAAVPAPAGQARVVLRIGLPDRVVTAEIAAKSLRRAQRTISEAGADNIALLLQGRLTAGDVISEAGISTQPKTIAGANAMASKHGGGDGDPPRNCA